MADASMINLIDILRSRNLPIDHDAIASASDDPDSQTAIKAWMQEYFGPETLLSHEEAALYASLSKTGEADKLAASQDLATIEGLNDQEIEDAIEELKRSTAAIEKQSETLRVQQDAMRRLVKSNTRSKDTRSQIAQSQLRKWELEKTHTNSAIGDLTQSLKFRISDLEQQSRTSEITLKQAVEGILNSDDKLLSSLQKLAGEIEVDQSDDDKTIARIRELCARLIKHTVEGIRTKLDRIYFEALGNSHAMNGDHANYQEITDLKEELESLYSEILPVAQMSAEQQYLTPALQEISARKGQGQERSVKAIKYIHDCLDFLITRLGTFLERTEGHQCHQMAVQSTLGAAKKEHEPPTLTSSIKIVNPSKSASRKTSISEGRKASISHSPVKARGARRRSSTNADDDIEPEQQILRNLAISPPTGESNDTARIDALEKAVSDRISKLEDHASSLQSTTESSISTHLHDARITLQILQDALLGDTKFGNVKLLNLDIEEGIAIFEKEIDGLEESIDSLNLNKLQATNTHREKIIERWSR